MEKYLRKFSVLVSDDNEEGKKFIEDLERQINVDCIDNFVKARNYQKNTKLYGLTTDPSTKKEIRKIRSKTYTGNITIQTKVYFSKPEGYQQLPQAIEVRIVGANDLITNLTYNNYFEQVFNYQEVDLRSYEDTHVNFIKEFSKENKQV